MNKKCPRFHLKRGLFHLLQGFNFHGIHPGDAFAHGDAKVIMLKKIVYTQKVVLAVDGNGEIFFFYFHLQPMLFVMGNGVDNAQPLMPEAFAVFPIMPPYVYAAFMEHNFKAGAVPDSAVLAGLRFFYQDNLRTALSFKSTFNGGLGARAEGFFGEQADIVKAFLVGRVCGAFNGFLRLGEIRGFGETEGVSLDEFVLVPLAFSKKRFHSRR